MSKSERKSKTKIRNRASFTRSHLGIHSAFGVRILHAPSKLRHLKLPGAVALTGLLLAVAGWLCLPLVSLPHALFEPPPAQFELLDIHGQSLRTVRDGERPFGQPVPFSAMPQALIQATLAAEDKRFFQHPGVDGRATLRAARDLLWHRRIVS